MTSTPLPYSYNKGLPGQGSGSVYIFNRTDDVSSSEDESVPLKTIRSRNKGSTRQEKEPCDTIPHEVLASDTISSLALKYNCKVSEIKRINNIWNGNELSTRDNVLIPIPKHSLLLEPSDSPQPEPPSATSTTKPTEPVDIRTISIKSLGDMGDTTVFLERMNRDIKTLLAATSARTRKGSLGEVKSALTVERIFPKQVTSKRPGSSTCNMLGLVLGGLFLFVVIPVTLVYWEVVVQGVEAIKNVGRR